MTKNDEMRIYLDFVLDHERGCALENCETCQTARNIYESVRGLLFSGVPYPQVAIMAKRAAETGRPAGSVRKAAKRAA